MILEDLLFYTNDNVVIKIFSSETYEEIACYDGKDSIPIEFNDYEITDIFVENNIMCVEVNEDEEHI